MLQISCRRLRNEGREVRPRLAISTGEPGGEERAFRLAQIAILRRTIPPRTIFCIKIGDEAPQAQGPSEGAYREYVTEAGRSD
jgi:hypothetical protein